ncbi:hypothetical protein PHJA_002386100 [Phtheirospermum japonicum]|uniref:Uncharacterized protein n=1 Tax=Phtheirospermum japonicum TaxID=374723 RepID=A0A830D7N8_9LAMI|nr:hypothetical protein PHJA_002386100 [Phtheirospermum japonicum]
MEYPHNAVLLLCSSYEKGCRPYMCATSHRYSNCLEQYKKAHYGLLCPLCRGQVKGWTVVDPARKYLNSKKRSCMQDNCSFLGNYKDLRKHVKSEHPLARPRDVDPTRAEMWKKLENERELDDVFSTIRSTMPGAVVMGDYVIVSDDDGFSSDFDDDGDYVTLPSHWDYEFGVRSARRVRNRHGSRNAGQNVGLLAARRVGRLRGTRAST